jgi:two-component sensor histidine kinase
VQPRTVAVVAPVDVCWRLDGDVFAMSWTERNGPHESQPEQHGFGTTVIASMAKRTVDGEVELPRGQPRTEETNEHPAAEAVGEQQLLGGTLRVAGE